MGGGVLYSFGGSPSGSNNNNDSSQEEKNAEVKECIVKFWPNDNWMGEYGFDWFRTGKDPVKEYINENKGTAGSYYDVIGRYTGKDYKSVTMRFYRNDNKITFSCVPFEFTKLSQCQDAPFATFYLKLHQMKVPVVCENGSYYYYGYLPAEENKKVITLYIDYEDKKRRKDKKYKDKDFTHIIIIEYRDGKFKQMEINDLGADRKKEFGPGDKKTIKDKYCKSWHIPKDLIEKIYKNEDMIDGCLSQDKRLYGVKVWVSSEKTLMVQREEDGGLRTNFYYYQCGVVTKVLSMFRKSDEELDQKVLYGSKIEKNRRKYKLDKKLLRDPNVLMTDIIEDETVTAAEYSVTPARLIKSDPLKVREEMEDGRKVYHLDDFPSDDGLLHPYWYDYYSGHGFEYLLEGKEDDPVEYYFYPYMSLMQFNRKDKRNGLKSEGKIKVTIEGKYDEVELVPSLDCIKVSPSKISSDEQEVTISYNTNGYWISKDESGQEMDHGASHSLHYIKAMHKGTMVGKMFLMTYSPNWLDLCADYVTCYAKEFSFDNDGFHMYPTLENAETGDPPEKKWKKDKDEKLYQLLAQSGLGVKDEQYENMGILTEVFSRDEPQKKDSKKNTDITITELALVTGYEINPFHLEKQGKSYSKLFGKEGDRVPLHFLDDDHSAQMWERWIFSTARKEKGELPLDALLISEEKKPNFMEYMDRYFIKRYPAYVKHFRVHILDRFLVDDRYSDAEKRYLESLFLDNYRESVCLFTRSIEEKGSFNCNAIAQAIYKGIGLLNSYDNNNEVTFRYGTTTNIMDGSQRRYSTNFYQWKAVLENYYEFLKYLDMRAKYTQDYIKLIEEEDEEA